MKVNDQSKQKKSWKVAKERIVTEKNKKKTDKTKISSNQIKKK
jgi:hypothetical protein